MEVFCGRKQHHLVNSNNKNNHLGNSGATQAETAPAGYAQRRNSSRARDYTPQNSQYNFFNKLSQCGIMMKSNSQLKLRLGQLGGHRGDQQHGAQVGRGQQRTDINDDLMEIKKEFLRQSGNNFGALARRQTFGPNTDHAHRPNLQIDFQGANQPIDVDNIEDLVSFRQNPGDALKNSQQASQACTDLRQRRRPDQSNRNVVIYETGQSATAPQLITRLHPSSQPTMK